ncbi:MAG: hypothetical protein ABI944_06415 [Chthoniobacterales bacterium]
MHSFREFHLDEELPFPTDPFLYAETYVHGFDIGFAYQATRRLSLTLDIPVQDGRRTSYYEHDLTTLTEKHTMRASGVGDLRLLANIWIFDPDRHRNGNISLGLGFKLPTGDYNAKDFSYRANGPVLRPVDPAIQPGDGGLGIVTAISGFQKLFKNTYAYLQGIYLINPRELNGTQQPTGDEPDFTLGERGYIFNSVPDQYLGRAGLGYLLWPKMGLSLTLGARVEGVPVEDLVGGSDGWRNAGYALSIEPGLTVSKGNFSFTVTGPVALKRHADKNLTDLRVSRLLGADIGGNAAFADYLITTSFSYGF